jgi:hypothetical protein
MKLNIFFSFDLEVYIDMNSPVRIRTGNLVVGWINGLHFLVVIQSLNLKKGWLVFIQGSHGRREPKRNETEKHWNNEQGSCRPEFGQGSCSSVWA